MSTPELIVNFDAGVLDLRLNRPEAGNQLTAAMCDPLASALAQVPQDARLVRLTGAGGDFCAGRESPMPPAGTAMDAEALRQRVALSALTLYEALKSAPAPTLAVVRGCATGVGAALAAACDITIAAEDARFLVPEMDRDIPPTIVMAALADRVPVKTMAYLVLSGRALAGVEARIAGLVSAVFPGAELDAVSQAIATGLATNAPIVVPAVKQFLRDGVALPPSQASGLAGHLLATALAPRFFPERPAA